MSSKDRQQNAHEILSDVEGIDERKFLRITALLANGVK